LLPAEMHAMPTNEARAGELCYHCNLFAPDLPLPVVPPGSTLSELVAAATRDPELHGRVAVRVDGEEVRPEWWSRCRPPPDAHVEITLVPRPGMPQPERRDGPCDLANRARPRPSTRSPAGKSRLERQDVGSILKPSPVPPSKR
jgi:hypothetical protein